LRSVVAMSFNCFKDLIVLGTCAMPQTHSTLNSSEISAGVTVGKINAAKVLESEKIEQVVGLRGQDQQKPLLFPDIQRFVET
jgi:hypothetical protein